jgi:hypothetical protein
MRIATISKVLVMQILKRVLVCNEKLVRLRFPERLFLSLPILVRNHIEIVLRSLMLLDYLLWRFLFASTRFR